MGLWLAAAMVDQRGVEIRFQLRASKQSESFFHSLLAGCAGYRRRDCSAVARVKYSAASGDLADGVSTFLALLAIVPSAVLIYLVQQFNFLQIGRQKNLMYAVSVTVLALLYLALVRRVSTWLAPEIPPEASAAVLLFVLVIFIEPLQRMLGRRLQETAQRETDRVQR